VQSSGTVGDCTITGGYSIPAPSAAGPRYYFTGSIFVDSETNQWYSANGTGLDTDHRNLWTCGSGTHYDSMYEVTWLRTAAILQPNRPFTGGPLEGDFDWTGAGRFGHSQWSLHPAGDCSPSPEPVCQ